jgi:hypothetical protein
LSENVNLFFSTILQRAHPDTALVAQARGHGATELRARGQGLKMHLMTATNRIFLDEIGSAVRMSATKRLYL